MRIIDLSGVWQCTIPGQTRPITIPGTLDESGIGQRDVGGKKWHPDTDTSRAIYQTDEGIRTRLTRVVTYEGPAQISRRLDWEVPAGRRLFLEVERSRHLSLRVNGCEVPPARERTISTPSVFEVTGRMTGRDEIVFIADNSYPGWPHDAIVCSSAATDETQTNWNGLLGYVRLRVEAPDCLMGVRVYPHGDRADVCVEIDAIQQGETSLTLTSDALEAPVHAPAFLYRGPQDVWLRNLPLRRDIHRWDEEEGNLYRLTVTMGQEDCTVRFGVRDFRAEEGFLTLNGRRIFLRGEANCAVFPEEGHPPMTVERWREVLSVYRSYGVNCMRFHSHTPPEAAFIAADEMGMLMQPELSHWNPETAFESEESHAYYGAELRQVLRQLANHPSFVMLTFGNELACGSLGHRRMEDMLAMAHGMDDTRLYACASNPHYGWYGSMDSSDFYTATNLRQSELRATYARMLGALNHRYPSAKSDYEGAMEKLRRECAKPVFSFEVGQFEVLPDFDEIADFRGVTRAVNYELIRRQVQSSGAMETWKAQVEATGELARLCYREEVEATLRTESYSGICLLGIQDFPGQGTALVGMLNAHLQPKPYPFAQPERFSAFFRSVLPLVLLDRYTYECTETLAACVKIANYGKAPLRGRAQWTLTGASRTLSGWLDETEAPAGRLTVLGRVAIPLNAFDRPEQLTLTLRFGEAVNTYPVWVYPPIRPVCPENVHECRRLDDAALAALRAGGTVYLSPDSTEDALPQSIQAQFTPDFWSVGTFPAQAGGMGQLIDRAHPLFAAFPTERHTNWQWWPMAIQRAIILPRRMQAIVAEMDSYAYLRPMAQLLECRCAGGRLMLSSLGLHQLQQYPEARALQQAVYAYLAGASPLPEQELTVAEVRALVK
ncbi:MAG: glycoside hydrolase family 2 TIM barrel-domain containing protein [Aristaeellaceae bacterium]